MKCNKISFFIASVLSLLIISCQKEVDDIGTNGYIHQSEGNTLVKFVAFDTSYSSSLDTVSVNEFNYDAQKRLSGMKEKWFDIGTTVVREISEEIRFYRGLDTLPSMVVKRTDVNGFVLKDTLFLEYNSDGYIRKDSLVKYENQVLKEKYVFSYDKTGVWDYFVYGNAFNFINSYNIPTNKIQLSRVFANSNIVSSYDSVYGQPAPGNYSVYKAGYVYDNNPNPFQRIALRYPDAQIDVENGWFNINTRNNPVSYRRESYGMPPSSPTLKQVDIEYKYNTAGYPIVIKANQNGISVLPPNVVTYLYYTLL